MPVHLSLAKQYGINLGHFMLMTWCVKIPLKCNINIGKKNLFDELQCKNLRDSICNSRFRFKCEREANFCITSQMKALKNKRKRRVASPGMIWARSQHWFTWVVCPPQKKSGNRSGLRLYVGSSNAEIRERDVFCYNKKYPF